MITIKTIEVTPIRVNYLLIKWKFEQTPESFTDYEFVLERSLSPDADFEPVYRFVDSIQYVDEVNYKRLWKNVFYRIKCVHIPTGEFVYSDNGKIGYEPNLEALEIIRRNDILLRNRRHGIGVPVAVFILKRDGIRCNCWDDSKKRVRVSNCEDCFGTGYFEGYHKPIITWVNASPDNKAAPLPQFGETEFGDTKMFAGNYPEILPKDVIIEVSNLRVYTVENVETTARRGCLLHQLLTLSYLDRSSVLYKLVDKHGDLVNLVEEQRKLIKLT